MSLTPPSAAEPPQDGSHTGPQGTRGQGRGGHMGCEAQLRSQPGALAGARRAHVQPLQSPTGNTRSDVGGGRGTGVRAHVHPKSRDANRRLLLR